MWFLFCFLIRKKNLLHFSCVVVRLNNNTWIHAISQFVNKFKHVCYFLIVICVFNRNQRKTFAWSWKTNVMWSHGKWNANWTKQWKKTLNLWYECPNDDMMKHFFFVQSLQRRRHQSDCNGCKPSVYSICVAINNTL